VQRAPPDLQELPVLPDQREFKEVSAPLDSWEPRERQDRGGLMGQPDQRATRVRLGLLGQLALPGPAAVPAQLGQPALPVLLVTRGRRVLRVQLEQRERQELPGTRGIPV